MSTQLSFLDHVERPRRMVPDYVIQGQEKPKHIARLRSNAKGIAALILAEFRSCLTPMTPTMCAEAMGLPLTTVRPRICQLAKRTEGPRLEHCWWMPRRDTEASSEGWLRYTEGETR